MITSAPPGDFNFKEFQRRVRQRLADIGYPKPTPLAEKYGLGRDFIRDIIKPNPRKKGVRSSQLPRLAAALDCDVEYLLLRQPEPRRPRPEEPMRQAKRGKAVYGGVCEPGVWRALPPQEQPPVAIPFVDLGDGIAAYIQRGDSLSAIGILDGAILYAKQFADAADGDVVILRRTTKQGLYELSARVKTVTNGVATYEYRPADGVKLPEDPTREVREKEEAVVKLAQILF